MTGTEVTMMLCGHYTPHGCVCPARRLKWWSFRRWILGPYPECVFDEAPWKWMSEADRELWTTAKNQELKNLPDPVTCQYIIPVEPEGEAR